MSLQKHTKSHQAREDCDVQFNDLNVNIHIHIVSVDIERRYFRFGKYKDDVMGNPNKFEKQTNENQQTKTKILSSDRTTVFVITACFVTCPGPLNEKQTKLSQTIKQKNKQGKYVKDDVICKTLCLITESAKQTTMDLR